MGVETTSRYRPRTASRDFTRLAGRGSAAAARPAARLHPTHLAPLPPADGRRRADHRSPHRRQPAAHRRPPGPGPPHQLPACPVRRLLVRPPAGLPAHRLAAPLPRTGRHRHPGWRRRRRGSPRQAGLRPGPPPRPGLLQPFLHRLALRPPLGGPGRAGPPPLRHSPLGPARAGRPVPLAAGQSPPRPAAPHPRPNDVPAAPHAAAPLPRPVLRLGRRFRVRHTWLWSEGVFHRPRGVRLSNDSRRRCAKSSFRTSLPLRKLGQSS